MTRNGKIARLPREIREQLNRRLEDGEPGPQVLSWLNEHPNVRRILERDFGGRPVNEQNLSEWRQGGFRDWQRHQQSCDHVRRLTDQSEALNEATEKTDVSDRLATVFAVELFKVMEQLLEKSGDDKERLGYLREALREVRFLRRGDHQATRLQMEVERWEEECERLDEETLQRDLQEAKKRALAPIWARLHSGPLAEAFGGGQGGKNIAAFVTAIQYGLPVPDLPATNQPGQAESNSIKLNQSESNQIKPDWTEPGAKVGSES